MNKSFFVWLIVLPVLAFSGQVPSNRKPVPVWTPEQIDNAWKENLLHSSDNVGKDVKVQKFIS